LRGVSLSLKKGETLLITGGNGSGKSTLLRAIAGTAPVTSGKVLITGTDVTHWSPHRRARMLGFIHQDPMLGTCPNMTVHENLRLVGRAPWWNLLPESLSTEPVQLALIKSSGLSLDAKVGTVLNSLSGGQRQGAALIMALSSQRSILLMDEFTSSLDDHVRASYINIITAEAASRKLTILAVMHDLDGVALLSTKCIQMLSGRIA